MSAKHYKVLVTGADTTAALAITRSLGKNGIDVICSDSKKNSKSFYSKYCKNKFIYPSPDDQPKEFIEALSKNVIENDYDVLFPVNDTDMFLVSKYSNKFLPYVKIAMNDHQTFMKVLDKSITIQLASKLNIPVPETIFIESLEELNKVSELLKYPVVIKSKQSSTCISKKIIRGGTIRVASKEEFIQKYRELHMQNPFPLIQEYVHGDEIGIFVLFNKGELKAIFSHLRIRSTNPLGGASCFRKSINVDLDMQNYAIKLLREMKWEGVAMVEFKVDSKEKIPKLMEINGRFWGSLQLAVSSGVDFPYLLFKTIIGENISPILNYKNDVKCRDLYGDFIHLFNVIRRKDNRFEYPKKLQTLLDFMKFYEKDLIYDSLSFDEPRLAIKTFIDILNLAKLYFRKL